MGENPVVYLNNHMQATTRERGNLRCAQGLIQQSAAANDNVGRLDFFRYLTSGGKVDSAAEIGTSKQRGGTASDTGLVTSATGEPTK